MLLRSGAPLASYALELCGVLLLVHEAAGGAAALGPVFLALHLGLQLRALAHRALAGVVTNGLVDGHGILRCFVPQRTKRRKVPEIRAGCWSWRRTPVPAA